MRRNLRLTSETDFKRVRRNGRSYAHPLAVLIANPNELDSTRFGVMAGKTLGGAVKRNRAKRRLREALRQMAPELKCGWDIVIIARKGLNESDWEGLRSALEGLMRKAGLWDESGTS